MFRGEFVLRSLQVSCSPRSVRAVHKPPQFPSSGASPEAYLGAGGFVGEARGPTFCPYRSELPTRGDAPKLLRVRGNPTLNPSPYQGFRLIIRLDSLLFFGLRVRDPVMLRRRVYGLASAGQGSGPFNPCAEKPKATAFRSIFPPPSRSVKNRAVVSCKMDTMHIVRISAFEAIEWFAWALVEIAVWADCWGPFSWLYGLGNASYTLSGKLGERWGLLTPNPRFWQPDEPVLIKVRGRSRTSVG